MSYHATNGILDGLLGSFNTGFVPQVILQYANRGATDLFSGKTPAIIDALQQGSKGAFTPAPQATPPAAPAQSAMSYLPYVALGVGGLTLLFLATKGKGKKR